MSEPLENDFAHDEDPRKTCRSVMLTAFKQPEWENLLANYNNDHNSVDWSAQFDLQRLAVEIASAYTGTLVKFIHYQFELCPDTDAVHIHMIISFDKSVRWVNLRNCPTVQSFTRVNFKPVFNIKGAIDYCSKRNTKDGHLTQIAGPYSFGAAPHQGARNDLKAAIEHMELNEWQVKSVAEDFPEVFVKFSTGLQKLSVIRGVHKPADKVQDIILIYGPPGSGKSYYVYDSWPADDIYSGAYVKYSNLYHDGYANQPVLHYDEFSGHMMPFDLFKRLFQPGMDPKRSTIMMREGSLPMGSGTIIFTSNRLPSVWWDLKKLNANPWELFRRFTKIIVFGGEFGNGDNPTWHTELTSLEDRKSFMTLCCSAKSGEWDSETIDNAMHQRYFNRRMHVEEDMPAASATVSNASSMQITGHTGNDFESKRRRYMNLQPNSYQAAAPFL